MRCAIIDVGSNTARMNIYDIKDQNGEIPFTRVLTESCNLGLINYVENKNLSLEGIEKLIEALSVFTNLAQNIQCSKFYYIGTAALRNIDNVNSVISFVREALGIYIDIISGENEALLGFCGLKISFGDNLRQGIMIDVGGGSTEIIGFVDGLAVRAFCMPMGCLTLFRDHVGSILPAKTELKEIRTEVDRRVEKLCWLKNYGNTAYLVGGTARAAGKLFELLYRGGISDSVCVMSYSNLKQIYDYIKFPDKETIKLLVRTNPDRLHTLIPGICSFLRILKYSNIENIIISPTGIREGYLIERVINPSAEFIAKQI